MPNTARNWRLVQRSLRTLKPKLTRDELELLHGNQIPSSQVTPLPLTSNPRSASNDWIS
jgi:hypothetical protein